MHILHPQLRFKRPVSLLSYDLFKTKKPINGAVCARVISQRMKKEKVQISQDLFIPIQQPLPSPLRKSFTLSILHILCNNMCSSLTYNQKFIILPSYSHHLSGGVNFYE